jgi:predicted ABC-type exoprotein transport system permease subunit
MRVDLKNLVYHGMFVLVLSSLLTFGIAYAQETAATFPLGPMPKLIVFIVTIVISMVVDTVLRSKEATPEYVKKYPDEEFER